jgi:hypothetical protein
MVPRDPPPLDDSGEGDDGKISPCTMENFLNGFHMPRDAECPRNAFLLLIYTARQEFQSHHRHWPPGCLKETKPYLGQVIESASGIFSLTEYPLSSWQHCLSNADDWIDCGC